MASAGSDELVTLKGIGDNNVELNDRGHQLVGGGEVLGEAGDLHSVPDGAPVGDGGGDILEVVEHSTAQRSCISVVSIAGAAWAGAE